MRSGWLAPVATVAPLSTRRRFSRLPITMNRPDWPTLFKKRRNGGGRHCYVQEALAPVSVEAWECRTVPFRKGATRTFVTMILLFW